MGFVNSVDFARQMDEQDPLKSFRQKFLIPQHKGKDTIYLSGNSLGLQPRQTRDFVEMELADWARLGVEGHFKSRNPWFHYHKLLKEPLAMLTGAHTSEVVPMASLTTNLHSLLTSFYRPTTSRNLILMEDGAFPSDQYALESQISIHGLDPAQLMVKILPKEGRPWLATEEIITEIRNRRENLALILLSGVQYYTGQFFDLREITEAGHECQAMVGFDLAHAIGNVPLSLHEWQVDFAVWCSYKYLNSGPGATGGLFVHQNHHDGDLPRLAGWWGHDEKDRFRMKPGFDPIRSADGWQMSNANVLSLACQRSSLEIFEEAGLSNLRAKSLSLTSYLEFVLNDMGRGDIFEIITPLNPEERGSQLSLSFNHSGSLVHEQITQEGVVADWREPNVIRVAPVPLYNSYQDVYHFGQILARIISKVQP